MSDYESSSEYNPSTTVQRRRGTQRRLEQCSEDVDNGQDPLLQQFRRSKHHLNNSEFPQLQSVHLQLAKEPRPATAKEEGQRLIEGALSRDPDSKQFALVVIGKELPENVKQTHSTVSWAKINGEETERILDDAFAFLGSARLILHNPTVELLISVIALLLDYLRRKSKGRVTTYFMGHSVNGRFFLENGSINIADEVITKFNNCSTKMDQKNQNDQELQNFHYIDCCRIGEYFSFPANCLKGDAAVIYSTQPGQIAYTGELEGVQQDIARGSWASDGVGVFTREFAQLIKTHDGNFEEFAFELRRRTKDKLEELDPELKTDVCRVITHSTNIQRINFKEEKENAMSPSDLEAQLNDNGYSATLTVQQPPGLVTDHRYSVQTHRPQICRQGSDQWEDIGGKFRVTFTSGKTQACVYRVELTQNVTLFGSTVKFRILAETGDPFTKLYSKPISVELPPMTLPVLKLESSQERRPFLAKTTTVSWSDIQPPATSKQNLAEDTNHPASLPNFDGYSVKVYKRHEELQDCNEEIDTKRLQIEIDQEKRTASFKTGPGEYEVCVIANFEGGESVASELEKVVVKKPRCTYCGLFSLVFLLLLFFLALTAFLAVALIPTPLYRTQLYGNDVVECADSSPFIIRFLYSTWKFTECPNPLESAYNDINATVIPINGGKKGEVFEIVSKNGTFSSGQYPLPYPSIEPTYVFDRYLVQDSTVNFELCATTKQSSSSPIVIELFENFTDFASFVRTGSERNILETFQVFLTQTDDVCQNISYLVKESTYLYFAFYTPVDISMNITTVLGERKYLNSSGSWKYKIRQETGAVSVPISLFKRETVLCYSNTINYGRDRTHICATPSLGPVALTAIGLLWLVVSVTVVGCYCCCTGKCKRNKKTSRARYGRGNYRRLPNTTVQV